LNLSSIGIAELAGVQTVQRTVTSVAKEKGWRTYNVSVDTPPGHEVTVSPSTIRLRSGESATYYATFTNASAPFGEWRFGSLNWVEQGGEYSVYSAIAVKPVALDTPDNVRGTGTNGSLSFDIKSGYTGPYSVNPHDLQPPAVTSISGSSIFFYETFEVSQASLFRAAIPPEATEPGVDLVMCVQTPGGDIFCSDRRGITDERLDIVAPEDGIYTVSGFNWTVLFGGPGSSDIDLYTWTVPFASGDILSINAAPTSAKLGITETIDLSWTGLDLGTHYLGAVSHIGPDGLLETTPIQVDTR
jgi:hypothetical protein